MKRGDFPGSLQNMLKPIVGYFLTKVVSQIAINERGLTDDILGKDAREGLKAYITGPLKSQFMSENNNTLPKEMNFIFGHTHKPFCKSENGFGEKGFPEEIGIMNTGGWVIDTVQPQKQVGGAIALIDEDKNVVLLRLYNETNLDIRLETSDPENPLFQKLKDKLDLKSKTFTEFTKSIDLGIQNKRMVIKNRISK